MAMHSRDIKIIAICVSSQNPDDFKGAAQLRNELVKCLETGWELISDVGTANFVVYILKRDVR